MIALIELRPWSRAAFRILLGNNTLGQTEHLGGPESEETLRDRQRRYLYEIEPGRERMLQIVHAGVAVGSIGYWQRTWRERLVYETGWAVLPTFQGRGIARRAAQALIALLRAEALHPELYAFPLAQNQASNAICRNAGLVLLGECAFEYSRGQWMRSNEWRLQLHAPLPSHERS